MKVIMSEQAKMTTTPCAQTRHDQKNGQKTPDPLVAAASAQQRFSAKTDNFGGQTSGRTLIVLTVISMAIARLFGADIQTHLTQRLER
jgi:hypothetical protein